MKLKLKAWLAAAAAAFSVSAGADILPTGLQPYEFVFEKFASTDFIAGFQFLLYPIKPDLCLFGTNLSGITVSLELLNLLQQPILLRLQIGNHGLRELSRVGPAAPLLP